jgi:Protein of unknown function (DUF1402)
MSTFRWSRFGLARRPSLLILRRLKRTGRDPLQPWPGLRRERERQRGLGFVVAHRSRIREEAERYGIAPEAIAGAVTWDMLENPYRRPVLRLGPGRVYPCHLLRRSEAEKVEEIGLVQVEPGSAWLRLRRLRQPRWAIRYVAAIMRRHADNYLRIAGVDISDNPGVLCTLHQGGNSEKRAARLARRRRTDPEAAPSPADEMGLWVERHADFLRSLVGDDPPLHALPEEVAHRYLGLAQPTITAASRLRR